MYKPQYEHGNVNNEIVLFLLRFAFVEFEGEDEAKEAMDTLNNTEVEGRTIRLEFSQQSRTKPEFGKGGKFLRYMYLFMYTGAVWMD